MDVSDYLGPRAFGPAYRRILENDSHAPGSVDRKLVEGMVRLCGETVEYLYTGFTPLEIRYQKGSRPDLEMTLATMRNVPLPESVVEFTSHLHDEAELDLDGMLLGGTEEEIIQRGTDWCTDLARVACLLSQIAGFPARIVHLYNLDQAYSGHVIVEINYRAKWGAMDSTTGIVYQQRDGTPASVWNLMNDRELVEGHRLNPRAIFTTPEQFLAAGIANYPCWESEQYDYPVTPFNAYTRSILKMSERGWPGGLRWLHGEDR